MVFKVKLLFFLLAVTGILVFIGTYVTQRPLQLYLCSCEVRSAEEEDEDRGFSESLYRSVDPFLSATYTLPQEAFSWWKVLQHETRSYEDFKKTQEELFQVLPPTPDVQKASRDHCRTCAVVGNSGNLKGSRYGPLIDAHDVILRMNTGQVQGFEADVGTKTTHRVMYPESGSDLDNTTHLVLFPFKIQDLLWVTKALTTGFHGTSYMPVKSKIKANKDLVMVINPAFMKYVHETWLQKKGRYPSTGFMVLVMALHICDEVHVFGFGADKDGNWSHYWEELKDKKLRTGLHPGIQEYNAIVKLAKQLKIKFYRGW